MFLFWICVEILIDLFFFCREINMDVIRYKLEEYSSMSHLISESKNSLPTIFIPEKCEVAPKYQKLIKSLPKKSKMILNQTLTPK